MPAPMFGYSMSRMADRRARSAERDDVEPLPEGADPLDALDPELRALVVSTGPAPGVNIDGSGEVHLADRLRAGLVGAAIGAALGAIAINVGMTTRRQRLDASAGPMDRTHTLAAAGVGAAIGAISGFARGYGPLERAPSTKLVDPAPAQRQAPASAHSGAAPAHPAFATLYDAPPA